MRAGIESTIEVPQAPIAVRFAPLWRSYLDGVLSFKVGRRGQDLITALALCVAALLVHHSWLTVVPLSAGDWHWVSQGQADSWLPWPTVWDATSEFGLKNFAGASEAPILAVAAALQHLGAPSGIWEKLLFFWPVAILSFVMPWLLAREVLGRSAWALLSPLIFAGNTYFLLIETGHLTVGVAETLAFGVLLAFIRSIRRGSVRWSVVAGLLFGVQAAYDIRIAYLTLLAALVYLILKLVSDVGGKMSIRRIALAALTVVTFAASQAYWWLPFFAYPGDRGIPLAASPWLAFMQLSHGITGLHPFWTGAVPTEFRTTDLNPVYFLVPVVAFGAILARRIQTEVLWLGLLALVAAFLIKQQNPPAGQIYDWMMIHVPGWSAFREASKLFFLVALAFAVLVPFALRALLNDPVTLLGLRRMVGAAILIAVVLVGSATFVPLLQGQLGGTTRATEVPPSFLALDKMLQSDPKYSPVLWIGGPSLNRDGTHIFPVASQRHPLVILKGTADTTDVLANFCLQDSIPFCYLDQELFHYLLARTGAGYVVTPIAESIGDLPSGTSREWIRGKLASILGPPLVSSDATLAVWRLGADGTSVVQARATAVVDAASQTTIAALPALEALGVPTVYQSSLSAAPLPGDVPSAVHVLPRLSDGCRSSSLGNFSVFARSSGRSLDLSLGGEPLHLPLLATPRVPADWAVYGPLTLKAGFNSLIPLSASPLGPCMEWSPLAAALLSPPANFSLANVMTSAERVSVRTTSPAEPWIQLMRGFDLGWTLPGADRHLVGDGLFNLYHMGTTEQQHATRNVLTFSFVSHSAELVGAAISLAVIASALVLIWLSPRSGNTKSKREIAIERPRLSSAARPLALAGLSLLVVAAAVHAINWYGVPSALKGFSIINDPYGADGFYIVAAMALLLASIILRLLDARGQAGSDARRAGA